MERFARLTALFFSFLLFFFLFFAKVSFAVNFKGVPIAKTIEEANEYKELRNERIFKSWLWTPFESFVPAKLGDKTNLDRQALANLALGKNIEKINKAFLHPKTKPFSQTGTHLNIVPGACSRNGDYDFVLPSLLQIVYEFGDNEEILWPKTRNKLVWYLLSPFGGKFRTKKNMGWLCGTWPETENHILMTETSRFLINELRKEDRKRYGLDPDPRLDNTKNGHKKKLLKYLQHIVKEGFDEYNSRPYQGYSIIALQNLYNYAKDPEVKTAAHILMDYLSATFAIQSNRLRRSVPFRRQKKYRNDPDILNRDAETARFAQMIGNFEVYESLKRPFRGMYGAHFMLNSAFSDYMPPDLITDIILHPEDHRFFQRFRHYSLEIHNASTSFHLSAGGQWHGRLDAFTGEEDGWAVPTTLIPTQSKIIDLNQFIRIDGYDRNYGKQNTCVGPNFACGINPKIPDHIPESCKVRHENWTFMNFDSDKCPLKYGFYVAFYKEKCKSALCKNKGDSFGFFEAAEPDHFSSFEFFKRAIFKNNHWRDYKDNTVNRYTTSYWKNIDFRFISDNKHKWEIKNIAHLETTDRFKKWPLAQGEIMNSKGDGLITFDNHKLNQRLVLDFRDPMNPKRRIESLGDISKGRSLASE